MHLDSDSVVHALWTQTWQLAVLAVAVALFVRFACRTRSHLAYLLWMLVVVKALTPPVWSSPTGAFSWARAETRVIESKTRQPAKWEFTGKAEVETFAESSSQAAANTTTAVLPIDPPEQSSAWRSWFSASQIIAAGWAVSAVLLMAVTAIRWVNMERLLRCTSEPVGAALEQHFHELARRLGLRRNVRLVLTSAPLGPAAMGFWPGTVVLPAALVRAKRVDELTPILAHELVHLRRWDTVAGVLQLVAQCAWWFHPAVWWANRQARAERERCCDDAVVAELACRPADYARTLVDILDWRRRLSGGNLPLPAMQGWDVTSQRVRSLVEHAQPFRRRGPAWGWLVLLMLAAVALPGAGLQLFGAPADEQAGEADASSTAIALAGTGPSTDEPPIDLEPTPEQRTAIEELKQLGLNVEIRNQFGKRQVSATFADNFKPLDKPLPLERLPGLEYLFLDGSKQTDAWLDAQLRAIKNLRPETMLSLAIQGQSTALNRLAEIPGLTRLGFVGGLPPLAPAGSATGRTLRLNQLKGLRTLQIDGITESTAILQEIAGLVDLESLYLSGPVTDAALAPLAKMTGLKRLGLNNGEAGVTLDLPWLEPLERLEWLTIDTMVSDVGLSRIAAKPGLKVLNIEASGFSGEGFKPIASLQNLRSLLLHSSHGELKLGPDSLAVIGTLAKLRVLSVMQSNDHMKPALVNDDVLESWKDLTDLQSLSLYRGDIGDRGMAVLAGLPKLRSLRISGKTTITDEAPRLAAGLRELEVAIPDLTNRGMSMFGKLTNLVTLELWQANRIDGEGIAALAPLAKLESLSLSRARLEGPGCAALAELRNLKKLDLSGCEVGNDATAAIGKLKRLETLNLQGTGLANEQLKPLGGLDALEELDLGGSPIDDAGLEALRPLKRLRSLYVDRAKTTEAGRASLAKAIPGLNIVADGIIARGTLRSVITLLDDESP